MSYTCFCGFCGIALIPMRSRKPPANLHARRKIRIKIKIMESDITDKAAAGF